jgi:ketosteroid isomerase-like protein
MERDVMSCRSLSTALLLCVSVGAAAPVQAQIATPDPAYITEANRLGADDVATILDVIARMNHAIDVNAYDLYASFYTADGVIDSGFGPPSVGRDAIVASLQASAPFITNKRHVIGNPIVSGAGDEAKVTYYLIVFERQTGLTLAGTAVITDTLRREDGAWRVTSHTTRMDPATLAAMQAAMSGG